jgi:VanZ family protein
MVFDARTPADRRSRLGFNTGPPRIGLIGGFGLLALVLALALSDDFARPQFLEGQDKVEHALAFLGLGFAFGWRASLRANGACALLLSGAAFGVEALQELLTTTREGAVSDALASCLGMAVGLSSAVLVGAAERRLARA